VRQTKDPYGVPAFVVVVRGTAVVVVVGRGDTVVVGPGRTVVGGMVWRRSGGVEVVGDVVGKTYSLPGVVVGVVTPGGGGGGGGAGEVDTVDFRPSSSIDAVYRSWEGTPARAARM
jgi:hypothetical protein